MATLDETLLGLVRDELRRGTDTGEGRSRSQLREAVGIGAGDLDGILSHLRDRGEASEQAPDEYVLTSGTTPDDDVDVPAAPEPGISLAEAEHRMKVSGPPALPGRPRGATTLVAANAGGDDVRVQLDSAVAGVMDADALGKLVEAGIGKAAEKQVGFVFEVTP